MIQRVQSIYLLLASLSGATLFGLPFAQGDQATDGLLADGVFDVYDNNGLLILAAAVTFLAFLSIFLFNNRKLQMNVGKLNLLLGFAILGWAGFWFFELMKVATFGFGLVMPLMAIILTYIANRNILKDEKLVRSADRLR